MFVSSMQTTPGARGGLIVETWNLMDSLAIMGQLGLLPG
jgi:hypothetical protein